MMLVNKIGQGFLKNDLYLRQSIAFVHKGNQIQKFNKKQQKAAADKEWRQRKSMNPYVSNVGMSRQLKSLNLDSSDPVFKDEDVGEFFAEADGTVEGIRDRSKAFRKQYKVDEEKQRIKAKAKIVYKKVYGKDAPPPLLTWMEKEMIKFLHKEDPKEWTIGRLAESFPATGSVIHWVLKERTITDSKRINEYNQAVTKNWKLLSRGQLELDERYEQHLKSGYNTLRISSGLKNLAEQEIMLEVEKKLTPLPKPAVPGEFASIIIDYNKKISKDKAKTDLLSQEVIDVPSIFSDNSIPGTPSENEVSPYKDTALLATNIDLKIEKRMGVEEFKEKHLKVDEEAEFMKKKQLDVDPSPLRQKYMEWVKREEKRSKLAAKRVPKIASQEVKEIVQETNTIEPIFKDHIETDKVDLKYSSEGGTYVFDADRGYQNLQVTSTSPDSITIPEDVKYKYSFFRMGDTVYDREGQFIYRIPGLG